MEFTRFTFSGREVTIEGRALPLAASKHLQIRGLIENPSIVEIAPSDGGSYNELNKELFAACDHGHNFDRDLSGTFAIASISPDGVGFLNQLVPAKYLVSANKALTLIGAKARL